MRFRDVPPLSAPCLAAVIALLGGAALHGAGLHWALLCGAAAGAASAGDCERCGSRGRITCPTCSGAGNLRKTCPTCKGTGRRPCTLCRPAQPDPARPTATPGKVPCSGCAGRGVTEGAVARTCFKCNGAREVSCPLCFGKGDLSCPRTRYEKTCATCGFAGTVPCPDCQGTVLSPLVPPRGTVPSPLIPPRGKGASAAPAPGEEPPDEGDSERAPDNGGGSASGPAPGIDRLLPDVPDDPGSGGNGSPPRRQVLSEAWTAFDRDYQELRALLGPQGKGASAGGEIRRTRTELSRLQKRAAESAAEGGPEAAELLKRVRQSQRDVERIDESWSKVTGDLERLERYHVRGRPWADDARDLPLDLTRVRAQALEDRLDRLQETLALARKPLAALRGARPEALVEEVQGLPGRVKDLEKDLLKLQTTAPKAGKAARETASTGRAERKRGEEAKPAPRAGAVPPEGLPDGTEEREASDRDEASAGAASAAPPPAKARRSSKDRAAGDGEEGAEEDGDDGSVLLVLLGVVAAASCVGLSFVFSRRA